MYSFSEIQKIITTKIDEIDFCDNPAELYSPIKYILSIGGKRIRPILTLMSANLFSDNIEKAIKPAIGLEIFHNFTLMHDDIMDKADVRRNKLTVHNKWNENIAILSGDAMMIKSYEFFFELSENMLKKTIQLFNRMAIEVCEGQQYDMNFEACLDVRVEEYIEMIRLKTSVLLSTCLEIGGILGGAQDKDANLLYEFGKYLGLAFQLKDDLLDSFGDIEKFGKKIGGDIISNKKTYLLINALNDANASQLVELKKWIELKDFDPKEKIMAIKNIYEELGIMQKTIIKIEEYHLKANQFIENVSVNNDRKTELKQLTERLMDRDY